MVDPSAKLTGFAPAKVNLALHVTGRRSDGLHLLDSVVAFADVGDHVTAQLAVKPGLRVTGPMARGVPTDASNLVLRAAAMAGVSAQFMLEKHLPAAAGIGGGSSDAAAALRAVAADLNTDELLALGADLPVCMFGRAARMCGVGEQITPLVGWPDLPAVLVNPGVGVATGAVFTALTRRDNPPLPAVLSRPKDARAAAASLATLRNDLEAPARAIAPKIDMVLRALAGLPDCLLARMSGSGATCFALFASRIEAAAAAIALTTAHPDWWVRDTTLS